MRADRQPFGAAEISEPSPTLTTDFDREAKNTQGGQSSLEGDRDGHRQKGLGACDLSQQQGLLEMTEGLSVRPERRAVEERAGGHLRTPRGTSGQGLRNAV